MRRLLALVLSIAAALAVVGGLPAANTDAARLVAIADVHGGIEPFLAILTRAGLIDAQRRWAGGAAVLVQTGDLTDRGAAVREILDLLIALEAQASAAGGRVHVLLGNHETMNMVGDIRDVSPDAYRTFTDAQSEARRERGFTDATRVRRSTVTDATKAEWMAAHPPGLLEYVEAFGPSGRYGEWLRSKPVALEVDGTIFMHAGIDPEWPAKSIAEVNDRARKEVRDWDDGVRWMTQERLIPPAATLMEIVEAAQRDYAGRMEAGAQRGMDDRAARSLQAILNIGTSSLRAANGPLWFRGYNTWEDSDAALAAAVLKKFKATRFVTGHSVQPGGRIRPRFGETFFLIDTGMLDGRYWPGGRPSALEIAGGRATPIYLDDR